MTVINTPAELKNRLLDAVIMFNDGISTNKARIINVGNMDDDGNLVYLHVSSLEKFRQQKNGKNPVQYCGWYDIDELKFEDSDQAITDFYRDRHKSGLGSRNGTTR